MAAPRATPLHNASPRWQHNLVLCAFNLQKEVNYGAGREAWLDGGKQSDAIQSPADEAFDSVQPRFMYTLLWKLIPLYVLASLTSDGLLLAPAGV